MTPSRPMGLSSLINRQTGFVIDRAQALKKSRHGLSLGRGNEKFGGSFQILSPHHPFHTIITSRKCSARSHGRASKRLKSGLQPLMATASSSLKPTKSDSLSALRTRWFTSSPVQENTMTVVSLLSDVPIPPVP